MTPRLSGHFSIFGFVFFVLKSLLGKRRLEKFAILTLKPRSHVSGLILTPKRALRLFLISTISRIHFPKASNVKTGRLSHRKSSKVKRKKAARGIADSS